MIAISPKRNAERKSIDVVLTELRQQDKRLTRVVEQFRSQALTDNTFVAYPEVPPVAVPLAMLDPEPSVVPGVGAS